MQLFMSCLERGMLSLGSLRGLQDILTK